MAGPGLDRVQGLVGLMNRRITTQILIAWVTILVTAVTIRIFFFEPYAIPAGTATVYTTLMGAPPAVYGLWKWARGKGLSKDEDKGSD